MESPLPPDPYAALGVPKNADAVLIKSTYRKLALKCHPDKVSDESKKAEATERFHSIQQAYDVIGDEEKRAKYDAQVRLAELRRQNLELRNQMGPRVEVRTAGYDVRTAAPPYASFTTRGPSRVYTEERRPSFYDDEEPPRASSRKYDSGFAYVHKRPSPKEEKDKRERVHVSDQERKRTERRREREADVREQRDKKYTAAYVEESFARYEEERRQRDKEEEARRKQAEARRKEDETPRRPPLQRKDRYEDRKTDEALKYMASQKDARPNVSRRTSTREVPTTGAYAYRRATAVPDRDRQSPRRSPQREPAPPEATPKRSAEYFEPYEHRPPPLQTENSAPPKVPVTPHETREAKESRRAPPHRSYTTQTDFDLRKERVDENEPPSVHLPHAHTFNDAFTSTPQASKRTDTKTPHSASSKPTAQPDSGYSSGATPDGQYPYQQYSPPPPPPQTTTTKYHYPKDVPSGNTTPLAEASNKFEKIPTSGYRVEVREPAPHREREAKPSSTATKMAHLAPGSRSHAPPGSRSSPHSAYPDVTSSRPSMPQSGSNRSIPRVSRSPERASPVERVRGRDRERERDRVYEYERGRDRERGRDVEQDRYRDEYPREKLYGEKGPGYIRHTQNSNTYIGEDGVSYSRRPGADGIVYSTGRSRGRDNIYDERRPPTSLNRSNTMPVYATGRARLAGWSCRDFM